MSDDKSHSDPSGTKSVEPLINVAQSDACTLSNCVSSAKNAKNSATTLYSAMLLI